MSIKRLNTELSKLMEDVNYEDKYDENFQKFITELEKISKKYGIGISAVGCFDYYDLDGFKEIKYNRDSSSGDLRIDKLIFSDGEQVR